MKEIDLVLDIGGTNTKYCIAENKKIVHNDHFKSYLNNISKYKKTLKENLQKIHKEYNFLNIYISTTAVVNEDGLITSANNNFEEYRGFDWKIFFKKNFPDAKIKRCLNDAKSLARYHIKKEQEKDFVSLTIGTGVGLAVVKNGQIMYGHNGISGEIGSLIWKDNLKIDEYFSATKLHKKISQILKNDNWSFTDLKNTLISNKEINKIFNQWASEFARLISWIITTLNPKKIFLAGGISYAGQILKDRFLDHLHIHVPSFLSYSLDLQISKEYNNSNMIGVLL